MTPGNIQLKVIVNKALLARVTGWYLSSEHGSAGFETSSEQVSFLPFGRRGQLSQEKPSAPQATLGI